MTRNILESDEVDSKIFEGRVITLLGEMIAKVDGMQRFLNERFYLPPDDSPEKRTYEEDAYADDEDDEVDA